VSLAERKRQFKIIGFLILLTISLIFPFIQNIADGYYEDSGDAYEIKPSAQRSVTTQWINNPTFEAPIEPTWYWENGTEGDNLDMEATTIGQANYDILGETRTYSGTSGIVNSSTSLGWGIFNNSGYLPPHTAEINAYGCNITHHWNETAGGDSQIYNYPSIRFKKNISLGVDISDYVIKSAYLEVIFNASVDPNIDTPNDNYTGEWDEDLYAIGDFATFYVLISDLDNDQSYTIAYNRTKYLGQYGNGLTPILNISDSPMYVYSQEDIITALNAALDKDTDHSNFTITLGIDIYSEDNDKSGDHDDWDSLMIKMCNFTFTYEKKIDQSTTLSWNQDTLKKLDITDQVTDAKFFFRYKVNNPWPSSAPLSEIKFYINDKTYDEGIIKLSNFTTNWQDAKVGGFDVTNLISTDVNITVSIEVFLKDTFELDQVLSISIDDVYLNITYIETFSDYGTKLDLFLDEVNKTDNPVIQIPIEDMLNVTVTYKDNESATHIIADSAILEGKVSGDFTEIPSLEQYYFNINSSELGLGISVLTVTIQKANYETKSIQIYIEVIERETKLQLLVDDTPRSNNETIDVKFNEFLNFTVFYEDNLTTTFISAASVELLGFGSMNETLNQYNFTLKTNDLSQGVNVLTIFAQKNSYQSQTLQIYVNVVERATQLMLYVDDIQKFDGNTIISQFDEFINITIFYSDDLTSLHIDASSVELLGFGSMNETLNQYNFTLNTNDLVQGVNVLTIFAQKDNYQSQTIQFFINIQVRITFVKFFVEGIERNDGDTINSQFDVSLNVTILFKDNNTDSHLAGAQVDLLGLGNFDEIGSQFNFTILTNILTKGINVLTIFAQLDGYQAQTIQFFINVDERATELILFVNGDQKNQSDTIQFEANELINITVFYKDYLTDTHLSGANVELLGVNNMDELGSQFNITINSNDLEQGINILTVFAQILNYQPKSIQFFIEVVERATQMQLYLNGIDKTADPVLKLPIGTTINITLKFYDNRTGFEIPSAMLQLIGESLFENLTENLIFNQYSIVFNSSNLLLGIKLFTIVAQAPTYQINTVDIRITVDRVSTSMDTVSEIAPINRGDNFLIQIVLNNTDFGGTIKNATVTYSWDNGQGILTDSNNDGIYEALLSNMPAGTYFIYINAYAGDTYDFSDDFEITLRVEAPTGGDIPLIIILSLAVGVVGLSIGFVLYQTHFKFPPEVRKMRKMRKKISKGKKLKPLTVNTRTNIISSKIERNKDILRLEKEDIGKIDKKIGGDSQV